MIFIKKILLLFVVCCSIFCVAEDKGTLYKIKNTQSLKGIRGLAAALAVPNTSFRYTPAMAKEGVLTVLAMTSYAISADNSVLALVESVEQQDGTFFNRIVFVEYSRFKVINGVEFTSAGKIEKIFFFRDKLIMEERGEAAVLKAIGLTRNLKFISQKLELPSASSSICMDRDFFYVKCRDKNLLQVNNELKVNSSIETRREGGVIFIKNKSPFLTNFTHDNLEQLRMSRSGIFKSDFKDLENIPKPESVILPIGDQRNFFFTEANGRLHELVDSSYSEKVDVSAFEMIFLHPFKRTLYLLANKKSIIEVVRMSDYRVIRKISHHSMEPESYKSLKFMIPHRDGVFLITQKGEFVLIRDRGRRYVKYKIYQN